MEKKIDLGISWVTLAIYCVSLGPWLLINKKRIQLVRRPPVLRERCWAVLLARQHPGRGLPRGLWGLGAQPSWARTQDQHSVLA